MRTLAARVNAWCVAVLLAVAGAAAAQEPHATVEMTNDLRFVPETVTIRPGDTVLWRNTSDFVHTVTADASLAAAAAHVALPEGAEPFHSGAIAPGGEYRRTFDVPGRYRYVCLPHEDQGMMGTILVEP